MDAPNRREELQRGLSTLKRSVSWLTWSSLILLIVLPVPAILLHAPTRMYLNIRVDSSLPYLGQGLVALSFAIALVTLWTQFRLRRLRTLFVSQMATATQQRVQADHLYGLSVLDPLTGLYNRRYGETRLKEALTHAAATGDALHLVALDFDHFKIINDQHGHAVGDMALKEFARRLRQSIRSCDVPIRVGGDEFLVLLPDCPPGRVDEILSKSTRFELYFENQRIAVSCSSGLARYQVHDTPESLIGRADERLYRQKQTRSDATS
jgi:diguanylate cyclase (GGDEF)-like protein